MKIATTIILIAVLIIWAICKIGDKVEDFDADYDDKHDKGDVK